MKNRLHFISGLPRSGSTLLAALLRQNPCIVSGMSSPVSALFNAMLRETSQRNEGSVFINDETRERLLRGVFSAYYADAKPDAVIFDTNRDWTSKLPALTRLFPEARIVCCVRNLAWIMDSVETLVRKNSMELSGIFGYDSGGTVYSRTAALGSTSGMVGHAFNALREAVYGAQADRLLLVRYESLVTDPMGVLAAIYNTISEPVFKHDPDHVEPCYDMIDFDIRLGTPGLHHVGTRVRPQERSTILPPDIFARFEKDAFWEDRTMLPPAVRVV